MTGIERLVERIDTLIQAKRRVTLAIDGPSGAGKSTLAARLQAHYDCNVVSVDSFFLRPEQRTPARLAEVGGNVDYERFEDEVLRPLRDGRTVCYRPYDCKTQTLGEAIALPPRPLTVVEGVYSLHPNLAGDYDLTVFLELSRTEQARRLQLRNAALYPRFVSEWIPMETRYFEAVRLPRACDLTLSVGDEPESTTSSSADRGQAPARTR